MFLLFLCLSTILVSSCPASCQLSSSPPSSSGSVMTASSHLSSRSTTAPTPFWTVDPAPSPSESGSGTRSSVSAASRPARLRTPSLAARLVSCFQTCWFLHPLLWRRFPSRRGGFCTPGTGGAFTVSTDAVPDCQRAPPQRLDLGPLLLLAEVRARG
jgi:hypothetical protein